MRKHSDDICNVDFVLPWVDGNDPDWLSQFHHFTSGIKGDKRASRYRDWNNLRFLFRGFEEFTPWVRKIHFVTWGHVPSWLNLKHEKLNVVRHEDFIEKKFLPVFNINPIEINLHKMPNLSECFVYFNDDIFITRPLKSDRFFKNGLPRDCFCFNAVSCSQIAHIIINDLQIIQKHYDKRKVTIKNISKIINWHYGLIELTKSILLAPWKHFTGFYDHHQPQPFLKSIFYEVWENESDILTQTSCSKVRNNNDVNQYLFRYWQLCKGKFKPVNYKHCYSNIISDYSVAQVLSKKISSGKYEMVCVNDNISSEDEELFAKSKFVVNNALNSILSNKSSFELN